MERTISRRQFRSKRRAAGWATAFAALISTAACGVAGAVPASHVTKLSPANLSARLQLSSMTFIHPASGSSESIEATYTISNPTNEMITYPQSGRGVDWQILGRGGQVVYDANQGRRIPQFIALRVLRAGEHLDFRRAVPLRTQSGAPLPSGRYTLVAKLATVDSLQARHSFVVR